MIKNILFITILSFSLISQLSARDLRGKKFVEGELIVKYFSDTATTRQIDSIKGNGAHSIHKFKQKGLHHVKLASGTDMKSAMEEFEFDPDVEYVQPNYIHQALATPNDTYFSRNWALSNSGQTIRSTSLGGPDGALGSSYDNPGTSGKDMKLLTAWDIITDCSSVKVAVLDTGVNYNHNDLATNMWNGTSAGYPNHGYNFVENNNDPMDKHGHGTHVAGTIGAVGNNATGTTGVCWQASLMAVRVLDQNGSGTTTEIISGIDFAINNGAKVINMSLGSTTSDDAELAAIQRAKAAGILVVVAAGNDGGNVEAGAPTYPCLYDEPNILCVAALTQKYNLASFSNYGANRVHVGAPGVNIVSSWPGTHTTTSDSLTSGWSSSGDWAKSNSSYVYPSNYDRSLNTYGNNADARLWKSYNLTGTVAAFLDFRVKYDFAAGDGIRYYLSSSSANDPIPTGSNRGSLTGTSNNVLEPVTIDLTDFIGSTSTVGFRFSSTASGVDFGAMMNTFSLTSLTLNNTTYNVISGTSMATPNVTGVAALIFAYNPNMTYSEVANAIKNSGDSITALDGKTSTGKAVNATNALAYINAPTSVSAVKAP